MDFEKIERIVTNQIRFVASIQAEYENKHSAFKDKLDNCQYIEEVEAMLLEHVKYTGKVLELLRKYNKFMQEELEMSYAKWIGICTPYEKVIHILRDTKHQLDTYLKIAREEMLKQMKSKSMSQKGYAVTPKSKR